MKLDDTFFKWVAFVVKILTWLIQSFGEASEKEAAKNFVNNEMKHLNDL